MAITPDLSTIFGGYSQPQQNIPLPEDPDHIARLIRELQDSGNSAQGGSLAQLVQQGMTKGLTVDPGRGLQYEQQGGGAQGYNGALRPSDAPQDKLGLLSPDGGTGAATIGKVLGQLGQPGFSSTVASNVGKGIDPKMAMEMLGLDRQDRALQQQESLKREEISARGEARQQAVDARTDARKQTQTQHTLDNLGVYYNKKTGAPATADFVDKVPELDALNKDYVALKSTDQRNDLGSLQNLDNDIKEYERIVKRLPLPESGGIANTAISAGKLKYGRFAGDDDVRDLDALRARLIATARAFGGTSKSADSIREVEKLEKAVVTDWDTKKTAQTAIDALKTFRDSKARTLPIPGLHNKYNGVGETRESTDKNGRPTVFVDGAWRYK